MVENDITRPILLIVLVIRFSESDSGSMVFRLESLVVVIETELQSNSDEHNLFLFNNI